MCHYVRRDTWLEYFSSGGTKLTETWLLSQKASVSIHTIAARRHTCACHCFPCLGPSQHLTSHEAPITSQPVLIKLLTVIATWLRETTYLPRQPLVAKLSSKFSDCSVPPQYFRHYWDTPTMMFVQCNTTLWFILCLTFKVRQLSFESSFSLH